MGNMLLLRGKYSEFVTAIKVNYFYCRSYPSLFIIFIFIYIILAGLGQKTIDFFD